MKKHAMVVAGQEIIVLVPDALEGQADAQALWLIAPTGELAESWLKHTGAELHSETAKAMLVCLPGGQEDEFYRDAVWTQLHQQFPNLSQAVRARRLLGLGDSGERCLKFVFAYPEKFGITVAVCPTSTDAYAALLSAVKDYMESGADVPRAVIADCAEGMGKAMGDAVNAYGVGMHVHSERPTSGWALMDAEIQSCLAHL